MKSLIILTVCVAVALGLSDKDYQDAFVQFSQKYSKSYHHDEFQYRFGVFRKNLDFINSYNNKKNGVTLAVNHFADLTTQEFSRMYKGLKNVPTFSPVTVVESPNTALPTSWDWNSKGAVTGIKNQGDCGSCWSFSTTGSVEGCHFISGKALVGLSEQNLIDCSYTEGDQGCDGGLMTDAMDYIISNNGVDTEASYPYLAEDGAKCMFKAASVGATMKSYKNVTQGSESDLQNKAYVGPTSVAIDASLDSFQFYSSGVYYDAQCSSTQLDHGVLVTGWGVDTSSQIQDYWVVKNSWGTDWGMNGWIWMARNKDNACGIATMATLPLC